LKCLYHSPVPCDVTGWYLIFDVVTLTDILVTWPWHIYTWYLACYIWHMIHTILNTWYLIPVLAMLYLLLDIWYRYLPCYAYYLIPDTGTCHVIFDIWYPTPVLAMLYLPLDMWHWYLLWHLTCYHLVLVYLIWCCDTCISLHIHDYHFYGDLIIILLPDIWYSWTPVYLNPWKRVIPDTILLLIPVIG